MLINVECCKKPLEELFAEKDEIERILKFSPLKKGHKMRLETEMFLLCKEIKNKI